MNETMQFNTKLNGFVFPLNGAYALFVPAESWEQLQDQGATLAQRFNPLYWLSRIEIGAAKVVPNIELGYTPKHIDNQMDTWLSYTGSHHQAEILPGVHLCIASEAIEALRESGEKNENTIYHTATWLARIAGMDGGFWFDVDWSLFD